jgi:hypothetical protein
MSETPEAVAAALERVKNTANLIRDGKYDIPAAAQYISDLEAIARYVPRLREERDAAVRESNRRDEKWKSGIEAECGCKIEFDPLRTDRATRPGPPTLGEFVRRLRERLAELESRNMAQSVQFAAEIERLRAELARRG